MHSGPALSATFSALGDSTRLALVELLREGDQTVGELASHFDLLVPAISKHLTVLEQAGLISRRRDGQRRWCSLDPAALARVDQWVAAYRDLWEPRLDRLDAYLLGHGDKDAP